MPRRGLALRSLAIGVLFLSGCASLSLPALTPHAPAVNGQPIYPHEIGYDLLDKTTATACADDVELALYRGVKSPDPAAIGPGFLYERAKYLAIGKITEADGLLAVRAIVESHDGKLCVTVTGRAYQLGWVRAVAVHPADEPQPDDHAGDRPTETPRQNAAPKAPAAGANADTDSDD